MPNPDDAHVDALREEIRDAVLREKLGELSSAEAGALKSWREQSLRHEVAYREELTLWRTASLAVRSRQERTARVSRRAILAGTTVAGLGGVATLGGMLGFLPDAVELLADHASPRGEQRRIGLAQGVTVNLDGASALDEGPEALELRRGAAVFTHETGADRGAPPPIRAGDVVVSSWTGALSVSAYERWVDVACITGRAEMVAQTEAMLVPGMAASVADGRLTGPVPVELEAIAAWRRGHFVFRNDPIARAVSTLNRHRAGRIVVLDKAVASRRISGVFPLRDPDRVLEQMIETLAIQAHRIPGGIVLLRS